MSTLFLKSEYDLADLENKALARKHLGLGTMATMNVGDTIELSEVTLDTLKFSNFESDIDKYAVINENGEIVFEDILSIDWSSRWTLNKAQDIPLSALLNDGIYQERSGLHAVALSGNYNDLENVPVSFSELTQDVQFLSASANLADISDKVQARTNLGIGTLALLNHDDKVVLNAVELNNLQFSSVPSSPYLRYVVADSSGNVSLSNIPQASTSEYGVVRLANVINHAQYANAVPTVAATNAVHKRLNEMIANLGDIDDAYALPSLDEYIAEKGLLSSRCNLSDISDVDLALSNLGIGTIAKYDIGDDIVFGSVTISDPKGLIINSLKDDDIGDDSIRYVSVNNEGKVVGTSMEPIANKYNSGMVYVYNNFDVAVKTQIINALAPIVPSVEAYWDFMDYYENKYIALANTKPTSIKDIAGYENFLTKDANLKVENPSIARTNLGLEAVASTGSFFSLNDRPDNLSYFSNDITQYLSAKSNLKELTNTEIARTNLGLGNMATMNSNELPNLKGEYAEFKELKITTNITLQEGAAVDYSEPLYLKCGSTKGDVVWDSLPRATVGTYGVARIVQDIIDDDIDACVSARLFNKVYRNFEERIADINMILDELEKK